jgi:hypothetical protein
VNLSEEYKRTTGNSPTGAWLINVMNSKLAVEWDEVAADFVSLIHISDTQGYDFLVERMGAEQRKREKRKVGDHDGPRATSERRLFSAERLGVDRKTYHLPVLGIVNESIKSAIEAVHLAADARLAAHLAVDVGLGRAGSGSAAHGAADDVVHEDGSDVVSLSDHEDAADNDAASLTFEELPGPPVPPGRPLKPWPDSENHIYGNNLAGDGIHVPRDYIPYSATEASKEAPYLSRNRELFKWAMANQSESNRRVPAGAGGGGGDDDGGGGRGRGGGVGAGTSDEDEDEDDSSDGGIALPAVYRELMSPHLYPGELPGVNHCQGDVCGTHFTKFVVSNNFMRRRE